MHYQMVQQHAAGFVPHTEANTGAELPRFIKDEFDASSNPASWRTELCGCDTAVGHLRDVLGRISTRRHTHPRHRLDELLRGRSRWRSQGTTCSVCTCMPSVSAGRVGSSLLVS